MIAETALTSFIAALFSMMNPIGNIGVFAGMMAPRPDVEVMRTAWSSAVAIAITLLIVTWTGSAVMAFFGINVDSLRAAGGVIVLIIGLHMLFNKSEHKQTETEREDAQTRTSIAVVPIAIPIVAGPGTMATVLVAAQQHETVLGRAEISTVVIALSVLTGLLFSFSRPISKWLGESGLGVVTRVMGVVLAAIAMGMLADGLKALLPGLAA
jgi:multiple antibiotic resistance protein